MSGIGMNLLRAEEKTAGIGERILRTLKGCSNGQGHYSMTGKENQMPLFIEVEDRERGNMLINCNNIISIRGMTNIVVITMIDGSKYIVENKTASEINDLIEHENHRCACAFGGIG